MWTRVIATSQNCYIQRTVRTEYQDRAVAVIKATEFLMADMTFKEPQEGHFSFEQLLADKVIFRYKHNPAYGRILGEPEIEFYYLIKEGKIIESAEEITRQDDPEIVHCTTKKMCMTDAGLVYTIKFEFDYVGDGLPNQEGLSVSCMYELGNPKPTKYRLVMYPFASATPLKEYTFSGDPIQEIYKVVKEHAR